MGFVRAVCNGTPLFFCLKSAEAKPNYALIGSMPAHFFRYWAAFAYKFWSIVVAQVEKA